MWLYRVDKRQFKQGDTISLQSNFETKLKDEAQRVEILLNKVKPKNIPERGDCLFLFHELSGALTFFGKYGGNLYRVVPEHIYHRGDMNKIDNILDIARYSDDEDILEAAANEYWKAGTHTFRPCYEYLVNEATVIDCLASDVDVADFRCELKIMGFSIERTKLFKRLVEK